VGENGGGTWGVRVFKGVRLCRGVTKRRWALDERRGKKMGMWGGG